MRRVNKVASYAGRFKDNANYLPRFYTDENFEAVERIRLACAEADISMVAATYAWLLNYSALREADGVLLGASSLDQLDVCLEACSDIVDLPDNVRDAFDGAWAVTRPGAAPASFWSSSRARRRRDPPFFAAQARSSTGAPTRPTCPIKRAGTRARPTTRRRRSKCAHYVTPSTQRSA